MIVKWFRSDGICYITGGNMTNVIVVSPHASPDNPDIDYVAVSRNGNSKTFLSSGELLEIIRNAEKLEIV